VYGQRDIALIDYYKFNKINFMNKMIIIFDGQCKLCNGSIDWIRKRALPARFEFVPCQSAQRKKRFPEIKTEDCLNTMQLILPDKSILAGADAIPEILTGLKGWRWLEKCLRVRLIKKNSPLVYSLIAKYRYFLACVLFK